MTRFSISFSDAANIPRLALREIQFLVTYNLRNYAPLRNKRKSILSSEFQFQTPVALNPVKITRWV